MFLTRKEWKVQLAMKQLSGFEPHGWLSSVRIYVEGYSEPCQTSKMERFASVFLSS